jgi:hypothetical protein
MRMSLEEGYRVHENTRQISLIAAVPQTLLTWIKAVATDGDVYRPFCEGIPVLPP